MESIYIVMDDSSGKPLISGTPLCIGCGICVNKCPFDALIITNLPEELDGEMTHRYGENGLRLFRLPASEKSKSLVSFDQNGMGKSTAINLLSGSLRPNLGDWTIDSRDWNEIIESFPRGELRLPDYGSRRGRVKIAVKPQYIDKLPKIFFDGKAMELLSRVDDRGELDYYAELLAIDHILDRTLGQLSGGELQRVAMAATLLKEADVYFFDAFFLPRYSRKNESR